MSKYILFVLVFGFVSRINHVDVCGYSASKTADIYKRQVLISHEPKPAAAAPAASVNTDSPPVSHSAVPGSEKPEHAGAASQQPGAGPDTSDSRETAPPRNVSETQANKVAPDRDHNGALLRSFYVFLGLCAVVMLYLTFRAFRVRPGAPAPATVRKYGVVGRRGDMEMLPLPLNEEEDDDTIFDAGSQQNR